MPINNFFLKGGLANLDLIQLPQNAPRDYYNLRCLQLPEKLWEKVLTAKWGYSTGALDAIVPTVENFIKENPHFQPFER